MINTKFNFGNSYAPHVVYLERFLGKRTRFWLSKISGLVVLLLTFSTIALLASNFSIPNIISIPLAFLLALISGLPGIDIIHSGIISLKLFPIQLIPSLPLSTSLGVWNGVLLLSLAVYIFLKMLSAFARSAYYRSQGRIERKLVPLRQFRVEEIILKAKFGDIVQSFLLSDIGISTLMKSGVSAQQVSDFLKTRSSVTNYENKPELEKILTITELVEMFTRDIAVQTWLLSITLPAKDFVAAGAWVERNFTVAESYERTWGRAAFSRLSTIGEDLGYGQGFQLKRYAAEVVTLPAEIGQKYGGADVLRLEESLSRDVGANALLIAPAPHIAEEIIVDFARDIVYHFQHPLLSGKRCYLFDVQYYCKDMDAPTEFEQVLQSILQDAAAAGNIIFVISDLPALYARARQLGADVAGVMRPYLSNDLLQVIAISDTAQYHEILAPQALLSEHYHDIHVTELDGDGLLESLEITADAMEFKHDIFFTVPALRQVIKDAERTLVHGILLDHAKEIIEGIPAYAREKKVSLIMPSDVDAFVSLTSNIPIGSADSEEQTKLLALEQSLHSSVVGQDIAITAISDAMRRSRAGVRSEKKPVASFLFFGPTGVGKTEVAKALAKTFFSGEENMLRFDMSEYADPSALPRLIGTLEGLQGVLARSVRERPYGVMLIDEFEKADPAVHDLFLQILDEGVFHDAQGKIVNCRNLIIIATSNAGAVEIQAHMSSDGRFDEAFRRSMLDTIIAGGGFRPELLNRFDGTILFTPIDDVGYRKIAKLMLEKLAMRLRGQGIVLVINDLLINTIVLHGVDPVFGARPMQRAIQDIVEKKVAEKILQGKAGQGVPLEFTKVELSI